MASVTKNLTPASVPCPYQAWDGEASSRIPVAIRQ